MVRIAKVDGLCFVGSVKVLVSASAFGLSVACTEVSENSPICAKVHVFV